MGFHHGAVMLSAGKHLCLFRWVDPDSIEILLPRLRDRNDIAFTATRRP